MKTVLTFEDVLGNLLERQIKVMMTLTEIVDTAYRQAHSSLVLVNQLRSEMRAENVSAIMSDVLQNFSI